MGTVAIVTRAYDAETPYIKSFIDYYISIGVREFHIVIPPDNPSIILKEMLSETQNIFIYEDYDPDGYTDFEALRNVALPHVGCSHILNVDVDEYLKVDDIKALTQHDYLKLLWTIAPFSDNLTTSRLRAFKDGQGKYLVAKECCIELCDHYCKVTSHTKQVISKIELIHYVYRSFNDLIFKCTLSNYQDYQRTKHEQLKDGIVDVTKLPTKFIMAAIYKKLVASASLHTVDKFYNIDQKLESKLIEQVSSRIPLEELSQSLSEYQNRLNLNLFFYLLKRNRSYRRLGRLPHSKLSGIANQSLDEKWEPSTLIKSKQKKPIGLLEFLQSLLKGHC